MKLNHAPRVNARYWLGITLASVFGTNTGDLYAHELGLGIIGGLLLLSGLTALCFIVEPRDPHAHEGWYWAVILLIRTGATNIADYFARIGVPAFGFALGLVLLLAVLAWGTHLSQRTRAVKSGLPRTDAMYWLAMLTAGVLGTALGDDCSHLVGRGMASASLIVGLIICLAIARRFPSVMAYWAVVAIARTAGTAIGDLLAKNRLLQFGLPLATILSGSMFLLVLVVWRKPSGRGVAQSDGAW